MVNSVSGTEKLPFIMKSDAIKHCLALTRQHSGREPIQAHEEQVRPQAGYFCSP